jgi:hypothetical protein
MTDPATANPRADIAALQDLVEESKQLRTDMRAAEDRNRFRSRLMLIFLTVMTLAVGGLATLVFQNQRISSQIRGCTNSGGACWEESRARSKNNVTAILNTTIFVAECMQRWPDQPKQQDALESCVRSEIASGRQPVPIPTSPAPQRSGSPSSSSERP